MGRLIKVQSKVITARNTKGDGPLARKRYNPTLDTFQASTVAGKIMQNRLGIAKTRLADIRLHERRMGL